MPLTQTIPALPVRVMAPAVARYVELFGFSADHADASYAVLRRDEAVIHLWLADDTGWTQRDQLASRPVRSGAESFLAGTASCRIRLDTVAELEPLYAELAAAGVLHDVSQTGISDTDFGAREFHTLDLDGNLVSFFAWV